MRRKGENISAFELEAALLELDEVADCGVVGRRRPDGDDDVIAFVIPSRGMLARCRPVTSPSTALAGSALTRLPTEVRAVRRTTDDRERQGGQGPAAGARCT